MNTFKLSSRYKNIFNLYKQKYIESLEIVLLPATSIGFTAGFVYTCAEPKYHTIIMMSNMIGYTSTGFALGCIYPVSVPLLTYYFYKKNQKLLS